MRTETLGGGLPDVGQLVHVRQRRFVVVDVAPSQLEPAPGSYALNALTHVLTLSSVDDEGLGEELRVVWELEPGTEIFERGTLPEPLGFDEPKRFGAFMNAVRWGAISSADTKALQAPFRSGIDIEDYQLDPIVRALKMPRTNLLVADDVGLGKTIEAGLVVQELLLRHRARTVLVVCPSSLQIQWRDQMRDKFGLEFRIVDSGLMKDLRRSRGLHVNPWAHFPRLITSVDFLKRDRPLRQFRELLPVEGEPAFPRRFDLLIVDEAHNVAPAGAGRYATDSLRTMAIRTLAPHFEHKLFLTATPHNGYRESFTALLELLDNQRFARGVEPDRAQLAAVMIRRLKRDLPPRWDGRPRFPERKLFPVEVDYPEAEKTAHRALARYAELRNNNASGQEERFATEFVLKLLKKRLFSSPAAFAITLEKHRTSLDSARRKLAHIPRPRLDFLRRQVDGVEEDFGDDSAYEAVENEVVDTTTQLFRELDSEEKALLVQLREFAEQSSVRADAKARALIDWLEAHIRPNGTWSNNRIIIFTEYRATQNWLLQMLANADLTTGERLLTLYGGMPSDDRERIKAAFQARPQQSPVRILLATDAASEGIDLQNHCSRLIHYEIPWNPNRLEQRNGRIDRHGQRANDVRVYHFVGRGYREEAAAARAPGDLEGDLEFLMRAARKVEAIREDLGKVGPVIAQQVEQAMLGHRQRLETNQAERDAEPVKRMLRFERNLRAEIDRLHEQLDETTRDLGLSPVRIQTVVETGLALAGQPSLIPTELDGVWPDPRGVRHECPVFHVPALKGAWARCTVGLPHPHTREPRPVCFDHAIADGRDDVVLAHLNHRLVQMCLRLLRAEIWATAGTRKINRVTARLVPNEALDFPGVIAHARLVVLGGDSHRLHEEVIAAGGRLREGRFARMNVGEVQRAIGAATDLPVSAEMRRELAELWPRIAGPLVQSLEVRMQERTRNLQSFLDARADDEAGKIRAILQELARHIREQLAAPMPVQYDLFTDIERDQLSRDTNSLGARLAEIPEEIKREEKRLRARFADPRPHLFPVGVTFLVPMKYDR
jgi:SNF2 family DNA or RNA helicase